MKESGVQGIFMYVEYFTKHVSTVPVGHFPVWGNRLQIRYATAAPAAVLKRDDLCTFQ